MCERHDKHGRAVETAGWSLYATGERLHGRHASESGMELGAVRPVEIAARLSER